MTIPARYEKGVFRPLEKIAIEEGTMVEVYVPVEAANGLPPIADSPLQGSGRIEKTWPTVWST